MAAVAASAANEISRAPATAARTRPSPCLGPAEDVLEHHDGVVHDDADGEREAEEGERVEREAQEVHHGERPDDRRRDRQQHVDRRGDGAEEQPADQRRQQHRQDQRQLDLVDRLLDRRRGVEHDGDVHALGERRLQLLQARLHAVGDRDGVRPALLADAEALRGLPVVPRDHAPVLEPVLDGRDVRQRRDGPLALRDHERAELVDAVGLAAQADVELAVAALEAARGQLDVLPFERADDVRGRDVARVHAHGVEPHPEAALAVAAEQDLAHAGHRLQPLADAPRQPGQLLRRPQPESLRPRGSAGPRGCSS